MGLKLDLGIQSKRKDGWEERNSEQKGVCWCAEMKGQICTKSILASCLYFAEVECGEIV